MVGRHFDVLMGYSIQTLIRLARRHRSVGWPVERALVASATYLQAAYGGPLARIDYAYSYKGETYSGIHTKAFLLTESAKRYAGQFVLGAQIPVRVNPTEPETSVVVRSVVGTLS